MGFNGEDFCHCEVLAKIFFGGGYTPSGEITFDTNTTSFLPLVNTPKFGWAYPIFSFKGCEGGQIGSLVLLMIECMGQVLSHLQPMFNCPANKYFKYAANFTFTFSSGFTAARVVLSAGRFDLGVGIGFSTGIVIVGPSIILHMGLQIESAVISLRGPVLAGLT
ncbi:hypothetical protein B0H13DRAFT_2286007 [Mycena leptocephala]|nr:hypothetical protein B0H13DRAFT_2286007 [Mycena leptocephala]